MRRRDIKVLALRIPADELEELQRDADIHGSTVNEVALRRLRSYRFRDLPRDEFEMYYHVRGPMPPSWPQA